MKGVGVPIDKDVYVPILKKLGEEGIFAEENRSSLESDIH